MRPFKAIRFSRNSKSGLIRNIINAGIRPVYEKVRSIFPYDKRDRGRSAEPTCERSLLFFVCYKKFCAFILRKCRRSLLYRLRSHLYLHWFFPSLYL